MVKLREASNVHVYSFNVYINMSVDKPQLDYKSKCSL